MERALNMRECPSKELFEEISVEMGVDASFIEKDWYAVEILKVISKLPDTASVIFTGGTSLSKGFNLIKRFSEDLDFKVSGGQQLKQSERRKLCHDFVDSIKGMDCFLSVHHQNHNKYRKTEVEVEYPKLFETPLALRKNLKIELFFDNPVTDMLPREIQSFVDEYLSTDEKIEILCNNPFYIAADKFNAITWRIYAGKDEFDYTNMRHLYDICALKETIEDLTKFRDKVINNFAIKDRQRVKEDISFADTIQKTITLLETDKKYREGYEKFVSSMSYASDDDEITYDQAIDFYKKLSNDLKITD